MCKSCVSNGTFIFVTNFQSYMSEPQYNSESEDEVIVHPFAADKNGMVVPAALPSADFDRSRKATFKVHNFVFTLNNYGEGDIFYLLSLAETTDDAQRVRFILFGEEVGDSGTPHLQGVLCFPPNGKKSWASVKKLLGPRYHVEVCMHLERAIAYCRKDGKVHSAGDEPAVDPAARARTARIGGQREQQRWHLALQLAKEGRIDDVEPQIQLLHLRNLEAAHQREQRKRVVNQRSFEKCLWYYGGPGTGKSRKAREDNPGCYLKMLNKWWDGYDPCNPAHQVVLIEDIDPVVSQRMAHFIKCWCDIYEFPVEIKGGSTNIRPVKTIITSNYKLEECFPNHGDTAAIYRRFDQYLFVELGVEPQLRAEAEIEERSNLFFNTPAPPKKLQFSTPAPSPENAARSLVEMSQSAGIVNVLEYPPTQVALVDSETEEEEEEEL